MGTGDERILPLGKIEALNEFARFEQPNGMQVIMDKIFLGVQMIVGIVVPSGLVQLKDIVKRFLAVDLRPDVLNQRATGTNIEALAAQADAEDGKIGL